MKRIITLAVVVGLISVPAGFAQESGTWEFDTDPGFTVDNGGGSDPNFGYSVAGGILTATLTREQVTQRIYATLTGGPYDEGDVFRMRMRHRRMDTQSASVRFGFWDSEKPNSEGLTNNWVTIDWWTGECTGEVLGDRERVGGVYSTEEWGVVELFADGPGNVWSIHYYDSDGASLIDAVTRTGTIAGVDNPGEGLELIGWGNEDISDNTTFMVVDYDWITYAVNTDLPADPVLSVNDWTRY